MHGCIGAVYFTLANIDPALRSQLEAICLVALFNSTLLKDHTLDDVLKPFIEDLKQLSNVSVECHQPAITSYSYIAVDFFNSQMDGMF